MDQNTVTISTDYAGILDKHGFAYTKDGVMLLSGQIPEVRGWVLHLTTVINQFEDLLDTVLPILKRYEVAFKIPITKEILIALLSGQLGFIKLGKAITVYPLTDSQAVMLAQELNIATGVFKGPKVLTDLQLGNVLFTRYSTFHKELMGTEYMIPASMPANVKWPFSSIGAPVTNKPTTVFKNKYKKLLYLKEDAKGDVMKGFFMNKLIFYKPCIIKEAKQHMCCDEYGRDMFTRLQWQKKVHDDLMGKVPVPRIYDFFEENGNSYLIMEELKGEPISITAQSILKNRSWHAISIEDRLQLINYAEKIIDIVGRLHANGYVHRDLNSANFLIDKKGNIGLIDMEMTYSLKSQEPFPPISGGTPGFSSPEQSAVKVPTYAEDIYAVAGILIVLLTGLTPVKFETEISDILLKQLPFFIPDKKLVDLIGSCFSEEPIERPSLEDIKVELSRFKAKQLKELHTDPVRIKNNEVDDIINGALKGLTSQAMLNAEGLWMSSFRQEQYSYTQMEGAAVYGGFSVGVSGVMYLLSYAKRCGYNVTEYQEYYNKSLGFILENYLSVYSVKPKGFSEGILGMAMTLADGIREKLINYSPEAIEFLQRYLQEGEVGSLVISNGEAGRGLIILSYDDLLQPDFVKSQSKKCVEKILSQQRQDGSWNIMYEGKKSNELNIRFGDGISGILYFQLVYLSKYGDNENVRESFKKGFDRISKEYKPNNFKHYDNNGANESSEGNGYGWNSNFYGVVSVCIKAYEILNDPIYKEIGATYLNQLSSYVIDRNLTLANGLSSLGRLYQEAAKVFDNDLWKEREHFIAASILHQHRLRDDGSIFWLVDQAYSSTSDFMVGNSGVIYMLLKHGNSDKSFTFF